MLWKYTCTISVDSMVRRDEHLWYMSYTTSVIPFHLQVPYHTCITPHPRPMYTLSFPWSMPEPQPTLPCLPPVYPCIPVHTESGRRARRSAAIDAMSAVPCRYHTHHTHTHSHTGVPHTSPDPRPACVSVCVRECRRYTDRPTTGMYPSWGRGTLGYTPGHSGCVCTCPWYTASS